MSENQARLFCMLTHSPTTCLLMASRYSTSPAASEKQLQVFVLGACLGGSQVARTVEPPVQHVEAQVHKPQLRQCRQRGRNARDAARQSFSRWQLALALLDSAFDAVIAAHAPRTGHQLAGRHSNALAA